jgi:hypothetical protein
MFEGWEDYYLLIGSAAAALIGLLFVVVTLTVGRDRTSIERGQKLYMTPIAFHLGSVLVLSGAAMAPPMTPTMFGLLGGAVALVGAAAGAWIAVAIYRLSLNTSASVFDIWWYGVIPAAAYLLLAGSSAAIAWQMPWAQSALAAVLMGLLLISIHNEWDLVTFLAPRADGDKS